MINIILFTLCFSPLRQSPDLWLIFEKVEFESRYVSSENASFYFPVFSEELLQLEGKRVVIKGYYLPVDMSAGGIVVSRYPMATCFFCGEAGPESVVMVDADVSPSGLQMDQEVTYEGVLELNKDDVYALSFILRKARRL